MGSLLVVAVGLGFAYAASPGAVNTECVRRGLARGFRAALMVQVGALLGDGVWAFVALAGLAALPAGGWVETTLAAIGGLFLCGLAFKALRDAWRSRPAVAGGRSTGSDVGTGAVFGLANPAGLAFWTGVGGGTVATLSTAETSTYAVFVGVFLGGALLWSLGLSATVAWGRRYVGPRLFRAVDTVCGAILGWFGLRLLASAARRISP